MAGARPEMGWNLQGAAPEATRKHPADVGGVKEETENAGTGAFLLPELGHWRQLVRVTPSAPPSLCIHSRA